MAKSTETKSEAKNGSHSGKGGSSSDSAFGKGDPAPISDAVIREMERKDGASVMVGYGDPKSVGH